jgi:hypothetical protein
VIFVNWLQNILFNCWFGIDFCDPKTLLAKISNFYIPHMKYGFTCKKKSFFIANFHVLRLFISKNAFRAKNKIPSNTRRCCGFLDEIWGATSSAVLSARKLQFWLQASFEPTWCTSIPQTILRILKFWNSFENSGVKKFWKMLDGSKFGKRCFLGIPIQNCFQIWKILNFL